MSNETITTEEVERNLNAEFMTFCYESRRIRATTVEGTPWFSTRDVIEALAIESPIPSEDFLAKLPLTLQSKQRIPTPDGLRFIPMVLEAGIYMLLGQSSMATGGAFQEWFMREVRPAIRAISDRGTRVRTNQAFAMANALSEQVAREAFSCIYLDQEPMKFARYLVTLSWDSKPTVTSIPDDFRIISADGLAAILDEGFISTEHLHEVLAAAVKVLAERNAWQTRQMEST